MQKKPQTKALEYAALLEEFKQILKKNALKFTIQREAILKSLYSCDEHLTPELLHRKIQSNYPQLKIGIATVYRTLALLESSKFVTSISFGAQGKLYELAIKKHHHDHMICTRCGNITEFVDEEIEKRQEHIAKEFGFVMQSHSMQIYGICKECQEQNSN